jgi:hypothetical protein
MDTGVGFWFRNDGGRSRSHLCSAPAHEILNSHASFFIIESRIAHNFLNSSSSGESCILFPRFRLIDCNGSSSSVSQNGIWVITYFNVVIKLFIAICHLNIIVHEGFITHGVTPIAFFWFVREEMDCMFVPSSVRIKIVAVTVT